MVNAVAHQMREWIRKLFEDRLVELDLPALKAHAAEHLARFKVPRWWEVVAELPHTPTDRIAKHQLPTGRTEEEIDLG